MTGVKLLKSGKRFVLFVSSKPEVGLGVPSCASSQGYLSAASGLVFWLGLLAWSSGFLHVLRCEVGYKYKERLFEMLSVIVRTLLEAG